MPFYEYQCSACGHHHEELQKVTDRPMRKCPACGRTTLRRLVSAPVFRLKGSGWYETDFKADKETKRNLAGERDSAEKDKSEKPKEEKAESKPSEKKAAAEAPAKSATAATKKPKTAPKPALQRRRARR
jgi:putative FmdB family regulatory protein